MMLKHLSACVAAWALSAVASATVVSVEAVSPGAYPIFKGAEYNAAAELKLSTNGGAASLPKSVSLVVSKPEQVESVSLHYGDEHGVYFGGCIGKGKVGEDGKVHIACHAPKNAPTYGLNHAKLKEMHQHFIPERIWVLITPSQQAQVGSHIDIKGDKMKVDGRELPIKTKHKISQSIGYMVAVPGSKVDGRTCKAFRIPGLIRTNAGTLVGCFDARYNHESDLCADIDVAVVRSTDGGRTWSAPTVGMDMGSGEDNGCGDPCILQDKSGRLWMQALTAHFSGGAVLSASKAGFNEHETGQWCMVTSDDDGKTWSKDAINPTKSIKKPEWTCILAGPGNGIVTKRGVIVFPAQIWQNGTKPCCKSTICTSADGGKTWKFGTGIPHATSECQVVELRDGSLMLNCRNESRSGKRIIYTTKDLGATWTPHSTNDKALQEPTCQASLIALDIPGHGHCLLFSNPKANNRSHMTVRASTDDGHTWNAGYEYDSRGCMGYSCIALADDKHLGIIYETSYANPETGTRGIGFVRVPIKKVFDHKGD